MVDAAANPALVAAVRASVEQRANPDRAAKQQAYMKSPMPYRGLTTPELRAVVRDLLRDQQLWPASPGAWQATIRELWDGARCREERYAALAIARHPNASAYRAQGALALYRHLVISGAWWDLVDDVATHLVRDELLTDTERVAAIMRDWSVDPDQWVRRAAIICQVGARERVNLGLLRDVIVPNLEGTASAGPSGRQDFFIRKAIGWALRDASYRHPDWVRALVDEHRGQMAGLTVREATKRLVG